MKEKGLWRFFVTTPPKKPAWRKDGCSCDFFLVLLQAVLQKFFCLPDEKVWHKGWSAEMPCFIQDGGII
jgi:hypothetical protein